MSLNLWNISACDVNVSVSVSADQVVSSAARRQCAVSDRGQCAVSDRGKHRRWLPVWKESETVHSNGAGASHEVHIGYIV